MSRARGFRAILLGPPGCGKGYISAKIVKLYGAYHLSTGDLLRTHIRHKTALGKVAIKYIDQGKLVPDHLLTDIVRNGIDKARDRNFVLDGYPRNYAQAKLLDEVIDLDFVLHLDIPYRVIIKRLKGRLLHAASGRVYNAETLPPKVPGLDDVTGEQLIRRPDDSPFLVLRRLHEYEQLIRPVLRFYSGKFIMHTIYVRQHESMWPQVKTYLRQRWRHSEAAAHPFRPDQKADFVNF